MCTNSHHIKFLLESLECTLLSSVDNAQIRGIAMDWREVEQGWLFVARKQYFGNTHAHIRDALERGASACLLSQIPDDLGDILNAYPRACIYLAPVEDPVLAEVCSRFFGHPTRDIQVFGITGTNGKTTTASILYFFLELIGRKPAMILTTGGYFAGTRYEMHNTTPDALYLQRFAAMVKEAGADCLIYEVSSHGLEIGRVHGVVFNHVAFTNLSREHLDFHADMGAYARAKSFLFNRFLRDARALGQPTTAIINIDDSWGQWMLAQSGAERSITFALRSSSNVVRKNHLELELLSVNGFDGCTLSLHYNAEQHNFDSPLIGAMNRANLGVALALLLGAYPSVELSAVLGAFKRFEPPLGRCQRVYASEFRRGVFIDYAHTPEALRELLRSFKELAMGAITLVFGAGGERDRGKRARMGAVAQEYADFVILTNDNPRNEEAERILDDIASGFDAKRAMPVLMRIPDREQAIGAALRVSDSGPVIIAGKGHERVQIIGDERKPFSDFEVLGSLLHES